MLVTTGLDGKGRKPLRNCHRHRQCRQWWLRRRFVLITVALMLLCIDAHESPQLLLGSRGKGDLAVRTCRRSKSSYSHLWKVQFRTRWRHATLRGGSQGVEDGMRALSLHDGNGNVEELEERDEISDNAKKRHLSIVFIGHVDAGKSTIAGHILSLTGSVDQRTMEKCAKDAKDRGRESWKYAYALDTTDGERNKGKTEECGLAFFQTQHTRFTILDAPGHRGYVPHMITGASQADVGILILSARKGEFETGFDKGGQTREHAILAKSAGVKSLLVCVNKMDDASVVSEDGKWSEARFMDIKNKLLPFLKHIGWKPKDVIVMPISGLLGEGLKKRVDSKLCAWYSGPSLTEALDQLAMEREIPTTATSAIIPVTDVYKERETICVGKLEAGILKIGDELKLIPSHKQVVVNNLAGSGALLKEAHSGEIVRIGVGNLDAQLVRPGSVLCDVGVDMSTVTKLEATLVILDTRHVIVPGYTAVMHIHAAEIPCTVYKLTTELNRKNGKFVRRHPPVAKNGMRVNVKIRLAVPTVVKPYKSIPKLGRFMLRAEGKTVAVGTVLRTAKVVEATVGDYDPVCT